MAVRPGEAYLGIYEHKFVDGDGYITTPWYDALQALNARSNTSGDVTALGDLTLNKLIVGAGGTEIKTDTLTAGQVPIGASDGTVSPANIMGVLPVVVTNSDHGIAISAPTATTGPAGPDHSIQSNQGGSFYGDANLTWDNTTRQAAAIGDGQTSTLIIDAATSNVVAIGQDPDGPGVDVGMEVVAGVEIARDVTAVYLQKRTAPRPSIALGASTGETPGSPMAYPEWAEWQVEPTLTRLTGGLIGQDATGAIPGKAIGATSNAAGAGASSTLFGQLKDGRFFVIWMDATGAMRYNVGTTLAAIRPTEDNSVSDTSGSLFGAGLSAAQVAARVAVGV